MEGAADALPPLEAEDSELLSSGSESLRPWGLCGDDVRALLLASGGVGSGTVATLALRMGGRCERWACDGDEIGMSRAREIDWVRVGLGL